MALQIRRGTEAERTAGGGVIFAEGELIYVTDTDSLYVGDGSTAGGVLLTGSALATIGDYIVADTINSTLDLQQDLDLNGNDVIGTGNINIAGNINATGNIVAGGNIDIGDAPGDTVTITAQVDSSITPETDTAYDLGTSSKRWRNVFANGATIDGQIDAVAINADVTADNSTVMVDVSTNTFAGDLTGDVTGNVTGDLTGDVTGDVTGNTTGYHTGDTKGSVFGDDSTLLVDAVNNTLNGNVTGNVTGDLTGNVTGNVTGDVKGSGGDSVLSPNTGNSDAELSVLNVTASGTISGNVTGNLTGNVTGDAAGDHTGTFTGVITATGTLDGDVTGSVFADDSTPMVDAVSKTFTGNLTGNVTGDVTGDIFTNSLDSADSSAIVVTPSLQTLSDVRIDQELIIGTSTQTGPEAIGVKIRPGRFEGGTYVQSSLVETDTLHVKNIALGSEDVGNEIIFQNEVAMSNFLTSEVGIVAFGNNDFLLTPDADTGKLRFRTFNGDFEVEGDFADPANFDSHLEVSKDTANFGVPVIFPNLTTTERNALTAEVGMVIFNTTDTKLQVCTVGGGTPTWVDLH